MSQPTRFTGVLSGDCWSLLAGFGIATDDKERYEPLLSIERKNEKKQDRKGSGKSLSKRITSRKTEDEWRRGIDRRQRLMGSSGNRKNETRRLLPLSSPAAGNNRTQQRSPRTTPLHTSVSTTHSSPRLPSNQRVKCKLSPNLAS
jgi:hypothetical protein